MVRRLRKRALFDYSTQSQCACRSRLHWRKVIVTNSLQEALVGLTLNAHLEMETLALDVVCNHFRAEHGQDALRTMRAQKGRLSSCNYRQRQKLEKQERRITQLTAQNARLLSSHAHVLAQNGYIRDNLEQALRIVTLLNRM